MSAVFDSHGMSALGERLQSELDAFSKVVSASAFIGLSVGVKRIDVGGNSHDVIDPLTGTISQTHDIIDFAGNVYVIGTHEFGKSVYKYNTDDTLTSVDDVSDGNNNIRFGVYQNQLYTFVGPGGNNPIRRSVSGTTWNNLTSGQIIFCDPAQSFINDAEDGVVFGSDLAIAVFGALNDNCGGPLIARNLMFWNGTSFTMPDVAGPPELGAQGGALSIEVYNGDIYVSNASSKPLWKWTGSAWSEIPFQANIFINDLVAHNGFLYVVGNFTSPSPAIAKFDGSSVLAVNGITSGKNINRINKLQDGRLIVSGDPNLDGTGTSVLAYDGASFSNPFSQSFSAVAWNAYQSQVA